MRPRGEPRHRIARGIHRRPGPGAVVQVGPLQTAAPAQGDEHRATVWVLLAPGKPGLDGASKLLRLLAGNSSYQVLAGLQPRNGRMLISRRLAVRFAYHCEMECARLYDHLLWLAELSSRAASSDSMPQAAPV